MAPATDVVDDLSVIVGIKNYVADPLKALDVNVGGMRNVLEIARWHGNRGVWRGTTRSVR